MKIVITGGKGMLGQTLQRELCKHELRIADLPEIDLLQAKAFDQLLADFRPEAVIHCAAMTKVDLCEQQPEEAFRLNAAASANVAAACHRQQARLLALSTDYVFSGELERPYHEFDLPEPQTVYGKSKLAGEEMIRTLCPDHVIARTAWLYGENGPSFVHAMLALARDGRQELKVVHDQIGNPTSTAALAKHLHVLLENRELAGTFHLTCEGEATWFELAGEIFKIAQLKQKVSPCTSREYPRPAARPKNSRLDKMRLRLHDLPPMPNWQQALQEFFRDSK